MEDGEGSISVPSTPVSSKRSKKGGGGTPITACEHVNQRHYAKGLCGPCYRKQRLEVLSGKVVEDMVEDDAGQRKPRIFEITKAGPAAKVTACKHKRSKHYAKGYCGPCYRKIRTEELAKARPSSPSGTPPRASSSSLSSWLNGSGRETRPSMVDYIAAAAIKASAEEAADDEAAAAAAAAALADASKSLGLDLTPPRAGATSGKDRDPQHEATDADAQNLRKGEKQPQSQWASSHAPATA